MPDKTSSERGISQEQEIPDFGQPAYELPNYDEDAPSKQRGVRWGRVYASLGVLLAVLIVVAELITRIVVGEIAASQIEASMPANVEADVEVTPTGWCVLCELAVGELSGLNIDGKRVEFGSARGDVDLRAEAIRLGDPVLVGSADGTIRIGEASLNNILAETTAEYGFTMQRINLRDGTFGYATSVDKFGTEVLLDVDATVRILSGGRIEIAAETLSLHSGAVGAEMPIEADRFTLEFCVAEHLPENLQITSVDIVQDALEVGFRTTESVAITDDAFLTSGSCGSS